MENSPLISILCVIAALLCIIAAFSIIQFISRTIEIVKIWKKLKNDYPGFPTEVVEHPSKGFIYPIKYSSCPGLSYKIALYIILNF